MDDKQKQELISKINEATDKFKQDAINFLNGDNESRYKLTLSHCELVDLFLALQKL